MNFITQKHLNRRTVLKGLGATIALPFLDAMAPARAFAQPKKLRMVAMEMVHGAAGSTAFGLKKNLWAPAETGSAFDLSVTALSPLEPWRDYITIVSNTDVRNAEAFLPPEIGGDHFRSAAVFLTQSHPKQTQGSDLLSGTSLDQLFAQKYGQETPMPLAATIASRNGNATVAPMAPRRNVRRGICLPVRKVIGVSCVSFTPRSPDQQI